MGRHGLGVASLARLGQHHVDAAPVHVTAAPFDQAVPGQPVDQAGQRALAQVDGLGQVLGPELAPFALGEPLQDLEVTDPEFTAPSSMSLLTTTFPEGPMRNRAFSVYTVFGASGFSLGLVLSGLLT